MVGDLDTHDTPCRILCRHAGAHILSVDYRLAPEHPFPAALEDGRAALRWANTHAADLGADAARIAVAGDSAGGNVATIVAWQANRYGEPAPAFQILIYPATGARNTRSRELFSDGFLLDRELLEWFTAQYISDADPADLRLSTLHAGDFSGVAPAFIVTAGFDPLRDEGEAYAEVLRESDVAVTTRRFPGLVHGFCNIIGTSPPSREALIEISGATRCWPESLAEKAMKSFSDKVAAITDAGSGIGRSLALQLAGHGCHLALCHVDEESLAGTVDLARQTSVKVTGDRVDVADRKAVTDGRAGYPPNTGRST